MSQIVVWQMNGVMNAGGTESLIMELFRHSVPIIKNVLVVHFADRNEEGIYDEEIRSLGIDIYYLPSIGSSGYNNYKKAFGELIDKIGKPDIIHSHINALGGIISTIAKSYKIDYRIVHCHADIHYRGSLLSRIKSEIILQGLRVLVNTNGTHFWACSEQAANRLFYHGKKHAIIPNVINVNKFLDARKNRDKNRFLFEIDCDSIIVGSIGRIAPIKNYETILDAIAILNKNNKKVVFYCIGRIADKKYYQSLIIKINDLKIEDNVIFVGNSAEVEKWLSTFDVFLMPSISEGLGISALEAQATGILTFLSEGIPNITDIGIGLVSRVSTCDALAWAENIIGSANKHSYISDSDIKSAFVKKGFDADTECQKIYKMYELIVRGEL